jgi:hypothetical protein
MNDEEKSDAEISRMEPPGEINVAPVSNTALAARIGKLLPAKASAT